MENGWKKTAAIVTIVGVAASLVTRALTLAQASGVELQKVAALEVRTARLEDAQTRIFESLGEIKTLLRQRNNP